MCGILLRLSMPVDTFSRTYLAELRQILDALDPAQIDAFAQALRDIRNRSGRLFILGVGGSAASASHATADFRKIAGIEAYAPTDNVTELTARTNDEGWDSVFVAWLQGSRLNQFDAVLVFSVGGGGLEASPNLAPALSGAHALGATIFGIVGRTGGYTFGVADHCILIPTVNPSRITPHVESLHSVLWHLLVNHPVLAV